MAKKKEITVEEKLRALFDLQLIDSRIDKIRDIRGELPLEVKDLEDELAGMNTRLEKLNDGIEVVVNSISDKKNHIEESKELIKKYTKQQDNVRNNREYDSLSKEIEFQELEIELNEKHIKEFNVQIEQKKIVVDETSERLKQRQEHLAHKQGELNEILAETEKEEQALINKSTDYEKKIEERLIKAYKRIRTSVKNGLAVVAIDRGASGGSFFTIPPQIQMEIAGRKKIITDEHSGRILVDIDLAKEEEEKLKSIEKQKIEDDKWSWHLGLDSDATSILNDLYEGADVSEDRLKQILCLFKLEAKDGFKEPMLGKPVYVGLAMGQKSIIKFKPQNLLTNLPLADLL